MFGGFNTTNAVSTISLLCGFLTIFTGVYLLNLSREDPDGENLGIRDERGVYHEVDGIPTDGLAGLSTRLSMQARRSGEDERHRRSSSWGLRNPRSPTNGRVGFGDSQQVMHSYDVEANGLGELAEDSDEDDAAFSNTNGKRHETPSHRDHAKSLDRPRR
nr:hypothetical protein CFP56_54971 [Quercus suber]POF24049.1 hypothetical protein CFP56_54985 [Quercus suber]